MKIQIRKVVEEQKTYYDEKLKRKFKYTDRYENGFVEEREIDLKDITAFSLNKSIRTIGLLGEKKLYPLTLKSWKELKKEINKAGLMYNFDFSRV